MKRNLFSIFVLLIVIFQVYGVDEATQCDLECEQLNESYKKLEKEFSLLKKDNCTLVLQKENCMKMVNKAHQQLENLSDEISHFCRDCERELGLDNNTSIDIPEEYVQAKSMLRNNRDLLQTLFLVSLYRQFTQKHVDDMQRKNNRLKWMAFVGGTILGSASSWFVLH